MRRRVVGKSSARRTVAGPAEPGVVALDDRPLSLQLSRDGKRVLVALPYEVWVINAATTEVERSIELPAPHPTVFESDDDGTLWFGGPHLHRGSIFGVTVTKVGTKLGGFVDRVGVVRPRLLCGVGTQGEVLWDLEKEEVVHRRKVSERDVYGLICSPDGRAMFADGSPQSWVIDPDHASGYMKLKLKATSPVDRAEEGIVALGMTRQGQSILAARDGAVAWTHRALRIVAERYPRVDPAFAEPLACDGDDRWIYVLRRGGVLDRFLVAQPPPDPRAKEEPEPLPEAQTVRLGRAASSLALASESSLFLAGPRADDQLGRLWRVDPRTLPWKKLPLGRRKLVEDAPAPVETGARAPSFERIRSKISGSPITDIKVDDVLSSTPPFWVTRSHGTLLERPVAALRPDEVLPGDALLLPAMFRFHEGTARPGLVLWPGVPSNDRPIPDIQWLTWGDDPRGWISLETPHIRAQGWTRREVFPLQVALPNAPPEVPGRRRPLPPKWIDPEGFSALVRECKKLLKVLW